MAPEIWSNLGWLAFAGIALGGALYAIGGVIYATERPNPAPSIFGYHEVFHTLVAGAASLALRRHRLRRAAVRRGVAPGRRGSPSRPRRGPGRSLFGAAWVVYRGRRRPHRSELLRGPVPVATDVPPLRGTHNRALARLGLARRHLCGPGAAQPLAVADDACPCAVLRARRGERALTRALERGRARPRESSNRWGRRRSRTSARATPRGFPGDAPRTPPASHGRQPSTPHRALISPPGRRAVPPGGRT